MKIFDPNGEVVFNISKETTKKELISIEGVTENVRRLQGINLSGGATNAVEFCTSMFKMPNLPQLLEAYKRQDEIAQVALEMKEWIDDSIGAADAVAVIVEEQEEQEEGASLY